MAERRTYRARLTLGMTLLSVGVLAVASAVVYVAVREALLWNLDTTLLTLARAEVASAVDTPGGGIHMHEESAPSAARFGAGYEKLVMVMSEDGRIVAQTANLTQGPPVVGDPALEARALDGEVAFGDIRRGDEEYRAAYSPYPTRDPTGRRVFALVMVSKRPVQQSLYLLLAALFVALLLGGAAAAWGARRLAPRLTRPLERIADAARAVGEENLDARIPLVSTDAELRDVTAILNQMLARLEAAFQTQRQLIAAQRRFVADASHELRSPLSNLRGTVEVALRRDRSSDEYQETLTVALAEIERLSRLVNDLLTLSRFDTGQGALTAAPCDVAQLVHESVAVHRPRAEEKQVQLLLDAAAPVQVTGDADRLREVIDNLLDNALRYAPPRSAVNVAVGEDRGGVRVSVQDAGPGLSPEDQARVFERFYRADGSRARASGGLGLGLAIANAIAQAHHGRLSVQSAPGRGATFALHLPRAKG